MNEETIKGELEKQLKMLSKLSEDTTLSINEYLSVVRVIMSLCLQIRNF